MFNFICQHVIQHQSTLQYANRMKRSIQSTNPANNGGGYGKYNSNYKGKDVVEAAAEATNNTHPYVAIWKKHVLCSTCYPEFGEGTACGKDGHNKKCYAILCTKCNMYGHPKAGCKQMVQAKA
jgi:hypothetical protein